jgi:hypothetical protein
MVKTSTGDTAIHNTASAQATDQFGTIVTAADSADTQLTAVPEHPGTGKLTGLVGCVYKSFMATVRGTRIAKVVFILDGKRMSRVTAKKATAVLRVRINPERLRLGPHQLVAKVTFIAGTTPKSKTLRLSFRVCAKRILSPTFTG